MWNIQVPSLQLQQLISQYGIYDSPARFALASLISPVSIVDSRVAFSAESSTPLYDTVVSAGEISSPGANTLLADTGPLSAGIYDYSIWWAISSSTITARWALQHRNAANSANIFDQSYRLPVSANLKTDYIVLTRIMAASERLRVIITAAGDANTICHANIFLKKR